MAAIAMYNYTAEDLDVLLTQAKNVFADFLAKEGALTAEQLENYQEKFAIIVKKPSFWTKLTHLGKEDEKILMTVVERKL